LRAAGSGVRAVRGASVYVNCGIEREGSGVRAVRGAGANAEIRARSPTGSTFCTVAGRKTSRSVAGLVVARRFALSGRKTSIRPERTARIRRFAGSTTLEPAALNARS
jgi:hypothetical protein